LGKGLQPDIKCFKMPLQTNQGNKMNITLAFCESVYLTIMGEEMPSTLTYKEAAEKALAKDRNKFMEMYNNTLPPRHTTSL
jgi:hypothetical protein